MFCIYLVINNTTFFHIPLGLYILENYLYPLLMIKLYWFGVLFFFGSFLVLFSFFFFLVVCVLHIFWILTPYHIYNLKIFSPIQEIAFPFVPMFCRNFSAWYKPIYFCFFCFCFILKKKPLSRLMSINSSPRFSSKSFIVSGLIFKSLIHFELMFVYGIR